MMENSDTRLLKSVRTFNVPLQVMWKVWTCPEHIVHWWGPAGFTCSILTMDFQEGGEWKLTLKGPDGRSFPNRSVFKEIVPHQKITFEHFNPHFITHVIFEPMAENTLITWTLEFDTPEMKAIIMAAHNAEEGQKQNFDKLERYLSECA